MSRHFAVVAVLSVAVPAAAVTQSRWEIGASLGGGPSVVTESWGGVPDHELLITTVYAAYPLIRWKGFSASWVGEILPAVMVTKVDKGRGSWFPMRAPANTVPHDSVFVVFPFGDGPDYGVGTTPVGLRLGLRLTRNVAVFAEGNGGGVAFARAMPNINARSVNFIGSAGGGLRFGHTNHRAFILGYRFTHISNANTALENPGFNAHVVYFGMTLR